MRARRVARIYKVFYAPARRSFIEHDAALCVHHVVRLVVKGPRVATEKKEDIAHAGFNSCFARLKN